MVRAASVVACAALAAAACGRLGYDAVPDAGTGPGAVTVSPASATVNLSSAVALTASGGQPPYTFATTGGGTVDDAGRFVAPARAGVSTVTVTDALGQQGSATVRHEGARLFLIGGAIGGVPTDSVLASDDGVSWTQVGTLPAARRSGAAVVYQDRIYYLGGDDANGASMPEVYASDDGATWIKVGDLPGPATSVAATVHRGELWVLGGWHAGNIAAVVHSSDGRAWTPAADLPTGRHEMDAVSRDGRLHVLGGHDDAGYLAAPVSTDDGASWTTGPGEVRVRVDWTSSAELGDAVFRGAGGGSVAVETSTDLATWTVVAPLPGNPREGAGMIGHAGRVLLVGGGTEPILATTDGSRWDELGTLADARARTAIVQFTPR